MNAATDPQLPERVSGAVSRAFRSAPLAAPIEETHGEHSRTASPGTRIGESHIKSARVAIADLVGARPEHVILGSSQLAESLSHRLRLGRQVVLSRVDDGANIDPWLRAADLYGADVRWAEADLSTGVLPAWQYTELVSPETAVVAVAA
ncbi:MAG: aminotransferase, partial [Corynebacterium urealyticum]